MPDEAGFEPSLDQLEHAVMALESGALDLDSALAAYERGVRLLARCKSLLDVAERKVALLVEVDPDGLAITDPYDASATVDRGPEESKTGSSKPRRGGSK